MPTEEYEVLVDTVINDKVCKKGSKVTLTERQAKYHVLAKKIILADKAAAFKAALKEAARKPAVTKPAEPKNKSDKGAK